MSYTPTGTFSTSHKMRLMLAACATMQAVMGAANSAAALAKIVTYGVERDEESGVPMLTYPRTFVEDAEVHLQTDTMGSIIDVPLRQMNIWVGFYVPDLVDIVDVNDEHAWVYDQFSQIVAECLVLTGRGQSIPGSTHLCVQNPVFYGANREPDDERGDEAFDTQPDRPRWMGLIAFEVVH